MVGISRQLLKEREQIVLLEQQRRPDIDPLSPGVNPEDEFLAWRRERFHRLLAEPSRRLSNGLGCLCFALVGIPVALLRRSGDVMSVFFLCFLPILLLYYPLLVLGESLARQGHFPQYSVWLADAVLCVIGLGLLHRSMRH
jgi:lipopolysaccharide export system permease protein